MTAFHRQEFIDSAACINPEATTQPFSCGHWDDSNRPVSPTAFPTGAIGAGIGIEGVAGFPEIATCPVFERQVFELTN
jgi:hypothetical protein